MRQGYGGVVQLDGNNKDGAEAISSFLDALDLGADYVQGNRFTPGGEQVNTPIARLLAIRMIHAPLVSVTAGRRLDDTTNGFRAYSRRYLLFYPDVRPFRDVFQAYEPNWYLSARASQLGLVLTESPVDDIRQEPYRRRSVHSGVRHVCSGVSSGCFRGVSTHQPDLLDWVAVRLREGAEAVEACPTV